MVNNTDSCLLALSDLASLIVETYVRLRIYRSNRRHSTWVYIPRIFLADLQPLRRPSPTFADLRRLQSMKRNAALKQVFAAARREAERLPAPFVQHQDPLEHVPAWKQTTEREPWEQCPICETRPFHVRQRCPELATGGRVVSRIQYFSRTEKEKEKNQDILGELEHHLALFNKKERDLIADVLQNHARLLPPPPGFELGLDEDEHDQYREFLLEKLPENDEERLRFFMKRRYTSKSAVTPPPEYIALDLPIRAEHLIPDMRRAQACLSPFRPWYPPPPRQPIRYAEAKESVGSNLAGWVDRQVVSLYDQECELWQARWPVFFQQQKEETKEMFRRLDDPRFKRRNTDNLEEEFKASIIPRRATFNSPDSDPASPPDIRGWRPRCCIQIEIDQNEYPGVNMWLVTNASWVPADLPRPGDRMRRIDGREGEHCRTRFPQWHAEGEWFTAFHVPYVDAQGNHAHHSTLEGPFAFYDVDLNAHFDRQPSFVHGRADADGYRAKSSLVRSISRDERIVMSQVRHWRERHHWAPDFPHGSLARLTETLHMLKSMTMSSLVLHETIAGCQEAMGALVAWCRYRQRLAGAFASRQRCIKDGMPFVPSTRPENVEPSVGVITDDRLVAGRYAQHDCPVWLLTTELEPFERSAALPKVIKFHFETRAWSSGSTVPNYMSNLIANEFIDETAGESTGYSPPSPGEFDFSGGFDDPGPPMEVYTIPQVDAASGVRDNLSGHRQPSPSSHAVADAPASARPLDGERDPVNPSTQQETRPVPQQSRALSHPRESPLPDYEYYEEDQATASSSARPTSAHRARDPAAITRGVKRQRLPPTVSGVTQVEEEEGEIVEEGDNTQGTTAVSSEMPAKKRRRQRKHAGIERGHVKHTDDLYFPTPHALAEEMAASVDLSSPRQLQNRTREDKPVPRQLCIKPHLLRTPDAGFFAGKSTEEATSRAFFVWVIICRFLDEYLHSAPLVSSGQGLTSKQWLSISKNTPWDWDTKLNEPDPDVTLKIATQLGMARLMLPEPTIVEVPRPVFKPMPKPVATDVDADNAFYLNLDKVGNGDGYYFYLAVPDRLRPPAPERDRFKYIPRAWARKDVGQVRSVKEFRFLLELDLGHKTSDQVIEFELVTATADLLDDWKRSAYDIWSDYEHDTVYVLRTYAEREQRAAQGERVFARPVRVMEKVNGAYIRRREKRFETDHCDIRVWHGFDLKAKIVVPADALEEVGSLNTTSRMQVPLHKWRRFADQAQVIVPAHQHLVSPSPAPPVMPAPALPAPAPAPCSVRQLIEDQLSVANGMYLYFDGRRLPNASGNLYWPPQTWREFIVWRTGEQHWRVSVEVADIVICDAHPETTSQTRAERHIQIARIWGGGGYIPTAESPLVSDNWKIRVPCVEALAAIVCSWPSELAPFPDEAREYRSVFIAYERNVFKEFSQVYGDYMFRRPPSLFHRPRMVWDE